MNEPLRFEVRGIVGEVGFFRLYECEHITEGTYPIETALPVGSHTNFLFCRHCWEGIKGAVAQELIQLVLRRDLELSDLRKLTEGEMDKLNTAKLRDLMKGRTDKTGVDHGPLAIRPTE